MKPRIGITADIIPLAPPLVKGAMGGFNIKLKKDYVNAVSNAGGLPFIIAPASSSSLPLPLVPSPLKGEGEGGGGEMDGVSGDYVASIADTIDGLLLTGGDDIPPEYYGETLSVPPAILKPIERTRIDFEISLFKEMMKMQKPILGICYGMQLVNVALGGSLYQDIEIQTHNPPSPPFKKGGTGGLLNHRQGQHEIKLIDSFLSTFNFQHSTFSVNSSHHQTVKKLGKGLEVFAQSDDGIIEGFYKPVPAGSKQGRDYPFLVCVQWHPERDMRKDEISAALFKAFVEASKKAK